MLRASRPRLRFAPRQNSTVKIMTGSAITPARPAFGHGLAIVLLVLIPVALLVSWHTMALPAPSPTIRGVPSGPVNGYLYDDAYISFRYAEHLAAGHGLVWNIGGEPTQGYTNFLFVVLCAAGIRAGLSAETAAHLLNLIGVILIGLAGTAAARLTVHRASPLLCALPGLLAACNPAVLLNAMTGMETVFWAGLVAVSAVYALSLLLRRADRAHTRGLFARFAVTAFLGCLTRPESALFAALWLALLFLFSDRRAALITGLAFAGAGALYLVFLQATFGAILPNAFYVKVADAALLPGREYVADFVLHQVLALGPILLPALGLFTLPRRAWAALLAAHAVTATLLVFYLFAFPLMGLYHRFVLPVSAAVWLLIGIGLIALLARVPVRFGLPRLVAAALLAAALIAPSAHMVADNLAAPWLGDPLFYANRRAGLALAHAPDPAAITVAYNDVGILPYVSGVRNLDTVGLNSNTIAREGKTRGWLWAIGYILGSRPDVIAFYTFPDGTVYNYGHGVIGGYYSVLADAQDFRANYDFAGAFDGAWVHVQFFVWKGSPQAGALREALLAAADYRTHPLRMP